MAIDKIVRDKAVLVLDKTNTKASTIKKMIDELDGIAELLIQLEKDSFDGVRIVISDGKFNVKEFLDTKEFKTYIISIVESKYSALSLLLEKAITNGK